MWFFYKETRSERLKDIVLGKLKNIGIFFYRMYYIFLFLLSLLLFWLIGFDSLEIVNLEIALASSVGFFFFFVLVKFVIEFKYESALKKAVYQKKENVANVVLESDNYPHQGKSTGQRRKGKDRFNTVYGWYMSKKLRREDVEEIKLIKILLASIIDLNMVNDLLMNENYYKKFFKLKRKTLRILIMEHMRTFFKVSPKAFEEDYNTKQVDMFHMSDWIVKNKGFGKHLMEYLIDYVILFVRLAHINIYLFVNHPMFEHVDHVNKTVLNAMPVGGRMEKLKSKDKINVFHSGSGVFLKTETGVNESNLDKKGGEKAYEDGSAHFLQLAGHFIKKFRLKQTDQVVGRNQLHKREHDDSNDIIDYVKDIPLAPKQTGYLKMIIAIKKFLNFWVFNKEDFLSLEKNTRKLLELQADKYLKFKVYMSVCGLKKTEKRLWFRKSEDLEKGGYIIVYFYAPLLYSLYNNQYAEFFADYGDDEEINYFTAPPYQSLNLNDELVKRMGLNDLRPPKK